VARSAARVIPALLLLGLGACDPEPEPLSRQELLDPSQCVDCHPSHVSQWRDSTHANAARDPVFQAMNGRYLRETGDADPMLCVGCHAPLAVQTGALTDPTALDALPEGLSGVGCMWCHQVDAVTGTHNAALTVAEDSTLRGGIADPIETWAHASAWSPLLDRDAPEASGTCGACHDVVLPNGVHLERTYAEWQGSVFNTTGPSRLGCGHCHMPGSTAQAAADGPARTVHDHTMPGMSVLDDPEHVEAVQRALDGSVRASICVAPASAGTEIAVVLENVGAGHGFPSGAAKHRRVWVELVATAGGEELLRSGTFDDDEAVLPGADLASLHELAWDTSGDPAAMLWEVAEVESRALPAPTTLDQRDPAFDHTRRFTWRISGAAPDTVTARVLVRPMGLDILDELVASGDLDPSLASAPTLEVAASVVTWQGVPGECTD
jgi:hypothetical protein